MAGALITNRELALWSQRTEATVAADPWAEEVIEKFSDYARFKGGTDWSLAPALETEVLVPFDVRMAVLAAARRTYVNPDSEVSSTTGPISSRILDEAALAGAFTESELSAIQGYHPDGDPEGIWVMSTTKGADVLPTAEVLYLPDDQQINLDETDSAWPSWDIPMFSPGDPGSD